MAGLVGFTPINTNDRDEQLIQGELSRCFGQFTSNPLLTGVLKKVSFSQAVSDVIVPHGLGSTNVSWLSGGMNLPAMIFTSQTKPTANQIVLQASQFTGVATAKTISSTNPLQAYVWIYLVS
jgi:hypothetical protein